MNLEKILLNLLVIIFSCIAQFLEDMKHGGKEVKEKFEVNDPKQVIDFLGMKGDAVDNIPGLPGDKTAKKFINLYGSMGLLIPMSLKER